MLMLRSLVLATNNEHKVKELSRLFPGLELKMPADFGIDFEYEETGSNFLENAFGKARCLQVQVGRAVLADDSGLAVAALDGAPGIHSARYGSGENGGKLTDAGKYRLLLQQMENVQDRSCFFVCCMVLMLDEYRFFVAQETLQGELSLTPAGGGGFGYDPIFYLPDLNKTVAELTNEEKDHLSHRGQAARRLFSLVAELPG